jgi:pimeloyl-ACP methyl ester carboxylesterase
MELLVLLGLGLAGLWAAVVVATAWKLTHPPRRTYGSAVARGRPGDPGELDPAPVWGETTVFSRGRSLQAWWIEGGRPEGPVVVMTHGWADGKVGALVRLGPVLPRCARVIAWDLPGHGQSPGRCDLGWSEARDLEAVLDQCGGGGPVVLFGWSLGAGVSLRVAQQRAEVVGVLAEAPYRSAFSPARNVLRGQGLPWRATLWPALALIGLAGGRGPRWMLRGGAFDRVLTARRVAKRTGCRVLVLHGEHDAVSPVAEGRDIAEAGHGQFVLIPDGTHNGLWTDDTTRPAVAQQVAAFLGDRVGAETR